MDSVKPKTILQAVIIGLLLFVIFRMWTRPSMFVLSPGELSIRGSSGGPASIFDLKPNLACTPGPSDKADYYTSGLTPGGLCGGMDFVHKQQRDYTIMNGVGGSLLEK